MMSALDVAAPLAHLAEHSEEYLRRLDEFLRIESVSADPDRAGDVRRAAAWLAAELTRIGLENVTIHETSSHPIVPAEWLHARPGAPTILAYGHYDVQPADPLSEWVRPPFEPRYEGGRIYARGAADDKGQLFTHLMAVDAWMSATGGLPLNLKLIFEGDEEFGSKPMADFMRDHRELLAADLMVVSDTCLFDDDVTPQLTYGMRGLAYFEVEVTGPSHDLHSGHYGGTVANPVLVLAEMLASLRDDAGRVTVPGFYDRVREPSAAERAAYAALSAADDDLRIETGVPALDSGELGFTAFERRTIRPTLDVNGIWGGYTGAGSKTIIPARVTAKLSARLVPDQDFHEIGRLVAEHLARIAPPTVRVETRFLHGGAPALTPIEHPAVQAAALALKAAFGTRAVLSRGGGTIPMLADAEQILGLKSILVGFAAAGGNFHSPNEWMPVANVTRGAQTIVHLLQRLAEIDGNW